MVGEGVVDGDDVEGTVRGVADRLAHGIYRSERQRQRQV